MSVDRVIPNAVTKRILAALVIWNVLDIALHVAVDEVEVLRVSANLILIAVAVAILVDKGGAHPAHPLVPALAGFIVLNLIVVIDKGPAVPMTILIAVSILLTGAAIRRLRPPVGQRRFGAKR